MSCNIQAFVPRLAGLPSYKASKRKAARCSSGNRPQHAKNSSAPQNGKCGALPENSRKTAETIPNIAIVVNPILRMGSHINSNQ